MSLVVHASNLRREMARRGWAATDLAREARLSQATISTALAGKPIAAQSLALIAQALHKAPVIEAIDALILRDSSDTDIE